MSIPFYYRQGLITAMVFIFAIVKAFAQQTEKQPYKSNAMGYSISFPGRPAVDSAAEKTDAVYTDKIEGITYEVSVSTNFSEGRLANWKLVIQKAVGELTAAGNTITDREDFVSNGIACTEVLTKNAKGYSRTRFLMANNFLYRISAASVKGKLSQPGIDKFMDSFSSFAPPRVTANGWVTYVNPIGAFSVSMPNEPRPINNDVDTKINTSQVTFKIRMFISVDTPNLKTYLVRYNNYPDAVYLKNKQLVFNNMISEFKGKAKTVSEPVKIWVEGNEGREVKLVLADGSFGTVRVFSQGNRLYLLLKETHVKEKAGDDDRFFQSFKILPGVEPDYYTYTNDSANFKLQMVAKPSIRPDSTTEYTSFLKHNVPAFSTNPNLGGMYDFEYSKISPYFRIESIDSLYNLFAKRLIGYTDTLLKSTTVMIDGAPAREIYTLGKENGVRKRMRILANDNRVYFLTCYSDSSELAGKTCNTVFNSLTLLHPGMKTFDIAASKAERICTDLASSDTSVSKSAAGALSYYQFTKNELPYVYNAIQRNYTDDTSEYGVRYKLLKQLRTVHDDSTVSVLSNIYLHLNNNDDLKGNILSTIPQADEKKGYDVYLKLLTLSPPLKAKDAYNALRPMEDSVDFAAAHFEQIMPYMRYDNFRKRILQAARYIAQKKDAAYDKMLKADYPQLTAYAFRDMDNYLLLKDSAGNDWQGAMFNYMKLASLVNDVETNDKFTARYIEKDPKGSYTPDAVVARVYNNLPNNPVMVTKYLDSLGTRYDLMEAYNSQKKLQLVPAKYRDPAEYARLCLYQDLIEDEDDRGTPTKIKLLGSIINKGSIYYVFKFSLVDDEDKKELMGITGPYKPGAKELDFSRYYAYSTYDIVGSNWRQQAQAMIPTLINNYKPLPAKKIGAEVYCDFIIYPFRFLQTPPTL